MNTATITLSKAVSNTLIIMGLFGISGSAMAFRSAEDRALQACFMGAKREFQLGNYDRISTGYGMTKLGKGRYEFYLNLKVRNDETGGRTPMKLYCKSSSSKKIYALRISDGEWAFVTETEAATLASHIAAAQ